MYMTHKYSNITPVTQGECHPLTMNEDNRSQLETTFKKEIQQSEILHENPDENEHRNQCLNHMNTCLPKIIKSNC